MSTLTKAWLFSCRYRNTYSIQIAAIDAAQASVAFTGWLRDVYGVDVDVDSRYLDVKRGTRKRNDERPLFTVSS